MKHLRSLEAVAMLLLIMVPSFALETSTSGDTQNYGATLVTENENYLVGVKNPIAEAIGKIFSPLTASVSAFYTKLNETIDYVVVLVMMTLIVTLLIVSQILLVMVWKMLIRLIIKSILLYRLLKSPKSHLPDLIEMLSNGKAKVSPELRKSLVNSKHGGFISKASLFLSYIL